MANSPQKARAANLPKANCLAEGAINRALSDRGEPFRDEDEFTAKQRA